MTSRVQYEIMFCFPYSREQTTVGKLECDEEIDTIEEMAEQTEMRNETFVK